MNPNTPPALGSARIAVDSQQETGKATRAKPRAGGGRVHCGRSRQGSLHLVARVDARCKRQAKGGEGGEKEETPSTPQPTQKGKTPNTERPTKNTNRNAVEAGEQTDPKKTKTGETPEKAGGSHAVKSMSKESFLSKRHPCKRKRKNSQQPAVVEVSPQQKRRVEQPALPPPQTKQERKSRKN